MAYAFGTLKERLQGAELKLILDGTVISASTIAADTPPVVADFTDDYLLGYVTNAKYVPETEERPVKYYQPGSGWRTRKDRLTLADAYEVTMKDFATALYDRLAFGLAAAPANNTAQQAFATNRRHLDGWMLLNLYEAGNSGDTHSGQLLIHVRLELQTAPEIKDENGNPVWLITHLADGAEEDTYKPYPTA